MIGHDLMTLIEHEIMAGERLVAREQDAAEYRIRRAAKKADQPGNRVEMPSLRQRIMVALHLVPRNAAAPS